MKNHFYWLWSAALSSLLLVSGCNGDGNANSSKIPGREVEAEVNDSEVTEQVADIKFSCVEGTRDGKPMPTTIIENPNHDKTLTIIYWNPDNTHFGKEWTPERRCGEVSERFQDIYDRDGIKYIKADKASWVTSSSINVVCSVKLKNASCEEDDLIFTLEPKDDPNEVLEELIAFRKEPSSSKSLTRGAEGETGETSKEPATFEEGKRVVFDLGEEIEKFNSQETSEEKYDSKSAF